MLTATHETVAIEKERGFAVVRPERTDLALLWGEEERPTILLIEDDPSISLALKIRLTNEGYDVVQASDASSGLRCANDLDRQPDIVILDLMLPGVGGVAVAESLLENEATSDLPVIFLTGTSDPQMRSRAEGLAPVAYLQKPFDFPRILDAIEETL